MAPKLKLSVEIPFHIQEEVIERLPIKSIVRFRCVCKAWRCLIDSSCFIAAHTARQDQHLFLSYLEGEKTQYVSIVDDETFPQQRFVPAIPLSIKLFKRLGSMVGICNGLVCINGYYNCEPNINGYSKYTNPMVVIWNPSIRKSIAIAVPEPGMSHHVIDDTVFGFGVCPVTNDPKIVMIPQLASYHEDSNLINDPREVMVYTLSSGKWRRPCSSNGLVLSKAVRVRYYGQVVIDRCMYWVASHLRACVDHTQWTSNMILSFDMSNDTFEEFELPDSSARRCPWWLSIYKLRESLVVSERNDFHCVVWMMEENGVGKSFTKLFTIVAEYKSIRALGLRKSGTPILKLVKDRLLENIDKGEIAVYEPNSQHFSALEISGIRSISSVKKHFFCLVGPIVRSSY